MSEYYPFLSEILHDLEALVTIVGLPGAIYTYFKSERENRAQREIPIVLDFSKDFIKTWDEKWAPAFHKFDVSGTGQVPIEAMNTEQKQILISMLNRLDWFGNILSEYGSKDHTRLLRSIAPQIRIVMSLSRSLIEQDNARYGREYWSGLKQFRKLVET